MLPGTKTRLLERAASIVVTIVTISFVLSYKYRENINIICQVRMIRRLSTILATISTRRPSSWRPAHVTHTTNQSTQCCLHTVMLYSQKLFPSIVLIDIYVHSSVFRSEFLWAKANWRWKVDTLFRKCVDVRCRPLVQKMCSVDSNGSTTGSQGIRGYISVMVRLKFNVWLKLIAELI